jgi:L-serine dehydratase
MLSVLDIFRVGIGPSSSHTVGPMRIALRFRRVLEAAELVGQTARVVAHLRGSLAYTGEGHGSPRAVALGLLGHAPESFDPAAADADLQRLHQTCRLPLAGGEIGFDPATGIRLDYETPSELHPNGLHMEALDANGTLLLAETYYSTGGGFIATARQLTAAATADLVAAGRRVPHPFGSAAELLAICAAEGASIEAIVLANEDAVRPHEQTQVGLDRVAAVMMAAIDCGLATEGMLPGGLKVERRAPALWRQIQASRGSNEPERLFDWLNVYAMAVNEENAAGGQVVTAPTNGAAGIIPAVIRHYCERAEDRRRFLLTAGGIGLLYKQRASISGAEMGCQGEVGVACSMAAAGLAAVWNATPQQVANAAEIGMEHNLGLTCDPVGGLVQIPCIERNAIGAVKAVNAARLALHRSGETRVSLDQVIETMRQTGLDMSHKYKETSQGGLAVNVVEC